MFTLKPLRLLHLLPLLPLLPLLLLLLGVVELAVQLGHMRLFHAGFPQEGFRQTLAPRGTIETKPFGRHAALQ